MIRTSSYFEFYLEAVLNAFQFCQHVEIILGAGGRACIILPAGGRVKKDKICVVFTEGIKQFIQGFCHHSQVRILNNFRF